MMRCRSRQRRRSPATSCRSSATSICADAFDKDAGPNNQRLYLNGAGLGQNSDTFPIHLNSAALGIGRHVSGIADPFNGHIDAFRISHVQRSDGWIATTRNNMSDPGAFVVAGRRGRAAGMVSRHRLPAPVSSSA